jgi:uncharacterized protein YjiS (DUF1127 family)
VTIASHELGTPRKSLGSSTFRIHVTAIFHRLANKWHRRVSCELGQTSDHYLRDMGIESTEMYDVSELPSKCRRVGPRGP